MAHSSSIFNAQPKRVPNRNGFDLSHVHSGTSKTGQLVPVLTKLLVPNSTISLGVNAEVNLPPLVSPFYGKVDFCIEGFVVPLSILYGGFKQFISNNETSMFPVTQNALVANNGNPTVTRSDYPRDNQLRDFGKSGYRIPYFNALDVARGDIASFNTLAGTNDNIYEYMGASLSQMSTFPSTTVLGAFDDVSLLPGLAYHRICDVFYRNSKLTKTWFEVNPNWEVASSSSTQGYPLRVKNVALVWHSWYTNSEFAYSTSASSVHTGSAEFGSTSSLTFPDGTSFFSTRQRCYTRDYFTSAVQNPQQGGASTLRFSLSNVSGTDPTGEFTINALRMANSLQKFLETNNLSGDFAEQMRNRWGVRPIDADFDEPYYLGRVVVPVYQHTLYQNNQLILGDSLPNSKNPYVNAGILGAKGGASEAHAEGSICDNFTCTTWAYLMVLASLVPHANYNYGNNKELFATKLGDFPAPELQGVGMEPIQCSEIYGYAPSSSSGSTYYGSTFGYTQRYARFKYMDDRVSGELKPGKSLQYFQLQRNFSDYPPGWF